VGIDYAAHDGMQNYRDVFCRGEGFDHVSRYVTDLIITKFAVVMEKPKNYWAFTKVVRLKRYGCKRLVIVHETADLSEGFEFAKGETTFGQRCRAIASFGLRQQCHRFDTSWQSTNN
jgi:hypothetical protein